VTATTTNAWAVGSDANHSLIEHRNSALAWSVVPSPANEPAGGELDAITAVSANDIWAVGHSRSGSVGNAFEPLIEHWNGTAWTLVPSPSVTAGNAQDTLSSVSAIGSSDVWAVGAALQNFSVNQTLAEHWDGTAWQIVPSANPGPGSNQLNSLAQTAPGGPLRAVGLSTGGTPPTATLVETTAG
jgi:hypothetical protein